MKLDTEKFALFKRAIIWRKKYKIKIKIKNLLFVIQLLKNKNNKNFKILKLFSKLN